MKRIATITILASVCMAIQAQTPAGTAQPAWQQYLDQLADCDDIEDDGMEDMYEQMCELEASPVDLNSATDDDLRRLTFLSDAQLEDLTAYIDRYRPLRSMGELAMIASLDPARLQLLRHFAYIGDATASHAYPRLGDILKHGKHELVATARLPMYTREGDRNGYLGYRYRHWMRYTFRYGQYLQVGLLGTQDAGEPFGSGGNGMGYDHYAYYAIARRLGALKTLALGQYKIRFGLGLTANTGFTLGKTASLVMSAPANCITPNTSRSDAYYLQGAAATVALGRHADITAFASYRKVDATLNDDGTVKTLLRTGYHRTASEMQRKHNTAQTTVGGNVSWRSGALHAGASGIMVMYDRTLSPDAAQAYRRYHPSGRRFFNGSIDYGYTSHRLNISGETAMSGSGAVATLNSISYSTSAALTLTAIQRYYSYRYNAPLASAFADGGRVQNESGIYIGATWTPLPRLSVWAFSDYAYFPWARYRASAASHSWDNMLQATYTIAQGTALTARYRLRLRQEDATIQGTDSRTLADKTEHRARITLAHSDAHWSVKTQADAAYTAYPAGLDGKDNSLGWMLTQTVAYSHPVLGAAANIGYFHTDDYNSRLYAYERGTLYSFSFPMFYGKGMRAALFLSGTPCRGVTIIYKVGTTKYFDRDHISSSYQRIDKSVQTDMDLQVKWKF